MKKALIVVLLALLAISAGCALPGQSGPVEPAAESAVAVAAEPAAPVNAASSAAGQPQAAQPAGEPAVEAVAAVASPEISTPPAPSESSELIRTARALVPAAIYAAADAAAPALGELEAGRLVVVTAAAGDRYQIIYVDSDSRYAWVSQDALTFDVWADSVAATEEPALTPVGAAVEEPTPVPVAQQASETAAPITPAASGESGLAAGTVLAATLNVRSGPGVDFAALGQLGQGQRVEIIDQQEGWLQIVYPAGSEGTGWVSAQYVAVAQPSEASAERGEGEAAPEQTSRSSTLAAVAR